MPFNYQSSMNHVYRPSMDLTYICSLKDNLLLVVEVHVPDATAEDILINNCSMGYEYQILFKYP